MKTILKLLMAVIVAVSLQTHAQGFVFDQQSTNAPSIFGDYLNIQTEPLTQSFIPSFSAIRFVQLELWDFPNNGTSGATVYVNLWTGSPNINSATFISSTTPVYMPDGFGNNSPGVTNFLFANTVALMVGQTYYLQPVVQSGDNPWDVWVPGNTYLNGQLYASGNPLNTDLWFREGVIATPEPATLALVGMGCICLYIYKRRSRLAVLSGFITLLISPIYAQTNSDSVVQITADLAGLPSVSAADVPPAGTFFVLQPNANGQITTPPLPALPAQFANLPIYQVTATTFLVDNTGGRLTAPSVSPPDQSAAVIAQAQIQSLSGLITQVRIWTNNYSLTNPAHPNTPSPTYSTNGLWLEIFGAPTNDLLILHGTVDTNFYQINTATNLLSTNWDVVDLQPGDWESDQTWFWQVPKTGPTAFYRAHEANAIMQVWDMMDAREPNATNSGSIGKIGFQNGDGVHTLTNDLKVYYTLTGTARNGIDYTNLPGMITLLAGMIDTNIIVQPIALGLQPDKTIICTLLQNPNYLIDGSYVFTTTYLYANPELMPTVRGDNERICPNNATQIDLSLGAYIPPYSLSTNYTIVTWPTRGILDTSTLPEVYYTPTNCFEGLDSFTFTVNNGFATSAAATVTLVVSDSVEAQSVFAATSCGRSISVTLSGSEHCLEGAKFSLLSLPLHGAFDTNSLAVLYTNDNPALTYTPTSTNTTGLETIPYLVTSACGGDTATNNLTIVIAAGPVLALGCNPFGTGHYVPLTWFLGTNEVFMFQQQGSFIDYKIYRAATAGGPYNCIGTNIFQSQTNFMDTNVVVGQTNYYTVTFEFTYSTSTYESPLSDTVQAIVPATYDFIAPDALWDVWDISYTNFNTWKGYLNTPFSSLYPGPYPGASVLPNTYWPTAGAVYSVWSNNIALVLPKDWTNQTQLAQVQYSIAIDNDYWLYLNHSTNFIESFQSGGHGAPWNSFQAFQTVAPGLLHAGTNTISVVIQDEGSVNYFSMVVTTNACGP